MGEVFTPEESQYLDGQELGRLATVGSGGMPHVVPVSFQLNRELQTIDIGGWQMSETLKFRHVLDSGRAAFVVDDVVPPWLPRSLEVRGRAEAFHQGEDAFIRIHPRRVISRGFDGSTALRSRRVPQGSTTG